MPSMVNAIGETISMTLVSDACSIVEKISPSVSMKDITPATTSKPNSKYVFWLVSPSNCCERYEMKPR